MIFGYFTLFVALVISAVAAYYSIVGLTSIFSAAILPIIIMGAALEIGKVTAAVWLKLNWARAKWTYKLYLVPAVAFLMMLTSMGIFGFLSKAHSDQGLISGDAAAKIAIVDEKIRTSRENIDANRKILKQLDEAVDQVMARSTDEKGADKAAAIRRSQSKERTAVLRSIEAEQKTIAQLTEERAPIAAEVRKVEAEVGPIKYIAAMIYGDNPDANLLEAAVRWVIILIVAVFDPLALVLILSAQQSIRWAREEKAQKENESEQDVEDFFTRGKLVARGLDADEEARLAAEANDKIGQIETPEPEVELPTEIKPPEPEKTLLEQHPYLTAGFDHFKNLAPMVYQPEPKVEDPVKPGKVKKAKAAKRKPPAITASRSKKKIVPQQDKEIEKLAAVIDNLDLQPGIAEPIANYPELQAAVAEALESGTLSLQGAVEEPKILAVGVDVVDRPGDYLTKEEPTEPVKRIPKKEVKLIVPAVPEASEKGSKQSVVVPEAFDAKKSKLAPIADNDPTPPTEVKAHFGITFPDRPEKGEIFLRVDYLPSRLFKYNGSKWIEVDKALTDSYVYNTEYIKYLVEQIRDGKVDIDDLSSSERDQIEEYLRNEQSGNTP